MVEDILVGGQRYLVGILTPPPRQKMAKKIEVVMPMGSQSIVMEEIKLNENIDDSVFARPTE